MLDKPEERKIESLSELVIESPLELLEELNLCLPENRSLLIKSFLAKLFNYQTELYNSEFFGGSTGLPLLSNLCLFCDSYSETIVDLFVAGEKDSLLFRVLNDEYKTKTPEVVYEEFQNNLTLFERDKIRGKLAQSLLKLPVPQIADFLIDEETSVAPFQEFEEALPYNVPQLAAEMLNAPETTKSPEILNTFASLTNLFQGFQNISTQSKEENITCFYLTLSEEVVPYELEKVAGDGRCSFSALYTTREQFSMTVFFDSVTTQADRDMIWQEIAESLSDERYLAYLPENLQEKWSNLQKDVCIWEQKNREMINQIKDKWPDLKDLDAQSQRFLDRLKAHSPEQFNQLTEHNRLSLEHSTQKKEFCSQEEVFQSYAAIFLTTSIWGGFETMQLYAKKKGINLAIYSASGDTKLDPKPLASYKTSENAQSIELLYTSNPPHFDRLVKKLPEKTQKTVAKTSKLESLDSTYEEGTVESMLGLLSLKDSDDKVVQIPVIYRYSKEDYFQYKKVFYERIKYNDRFVYTQPELGLEFYAHNDAQFYQELGKKYSADPTYLQSGWPQDFTTHASYYEFHDLMTLDALFLIKSEENRTQSRVSSSVTSIQDKLQGQASKQLKSFEQLTRICAFFIKLKLFAIPGCYLIPEVHFFLNKIDDTYDHKLAKYTNREVYLEYFCHELENKFMDYLSANNQQADSEEFLTKLFLFKEWFWEGEKNLSFFIEKPYQINDVDQKSANDGDPFYVELIKQCEDNNKVLLRVDWKIATKIAEYFIPLDFLPEMNHTNEAISIAQYKDPDYLNTVLLKLKNSMNDNVLKALEAGEKIESIENSVAQQGSIQLVTDNKPVSNALDVLNRLFDPLKLENNFGSIYTVGVRLRALKSMCANFDIGLTQPGTDFSITPGDFLETKFQQILGISFLKSGLPALAEASYNSNALALQITPSPQALSAGSSNDKDLQENYPENILFNEAMELDKMYEDAQKPKSSSSEHSFHITNSSTFLPPPRTHETKRKREEEDTNVSNKRSRDSEEDPFTSSLNLD